MAVASAGMAAVEMKEIVFLRPPAAEIIISSERQLGRDKVRLFRRKLFIFHACRPAEFPRIVIVHMTVTAGFEHAVHKQVRSRRDHISQIRSVAVALGELCVIRLFPLVIHIRHLPHGIPEDFRQLHAGTLSVPERREVALIDLVVVHGGLLPLHPVLQHLHRRGVLKPLHRSLQTALRIREHQGKEQKPAGFYDAPVADIFVGLKVLHQPLLMPLHAVLCLFEKFFIHGAAPGYLCQRAEPDLRPEPSLQRPPRTAGSLFH